ncbi:MAG: glycerate kinase [Deltaproteobacteria bacterium]|nr:glycerate kinase [Deltaproteobacteria bacterium]MBW2170944.1 glycerate kinase [Deltaproteobacteria bacterium]MBW2259598.1 glycerate kinase [Deltaproteobacteria bacterium]
MRKDALDIFLAGVRAVEPAAAVKRYCQRKGNELRIHEKVYDLTQFRNIYIIGAGKAGGPMARAMEEILGERITEGLVCVKYGHLAELSRVQLIEAAHPVPDDKGLAAAEAILGLVSKAGEEDLVLCLISGGGSALLPLPVEGLSLEDKQETTKTLLACGAAIHEINALRKHMSRVKGGGLARAVYPATLVSLILSDVIGDDLDVIASGPTVPDLSSFQDCMNIVKKYGIRDMIPEKVRAFFQKGVEGEAPETPKTGDPVFAETESVIIGSNLACVLAAEEKAQGLGYNTVVLSTMIEGETKEVAGVHVAIAKEVQKTGHPISCPACVLSGGETTVTITGRGLGGRNQEFVLAGAMTLNGVEGIVILSAGTDGNDGPTDAAGAIADGQTIARSQALGLNPSDFLSGNDSYHFFQKLGDLIKTGPTNTNVMDLRILLVK